MDEENLRDEEGLRKAVEEEIYKALSSECEDGNESTFNSDYERSYDHLLAKPMNPKTEMQISILEKRLGRPSKSNDIIVRTTKDDFDYKYLEFAITPTRYVVEPDGLSKLMDAALIVRDFKWASQIHKRMQYWVKND